MVKNTDSEQTTAKPITNAPVRPKRPKREARRGKQSQDNADSNSEPVATKLAVPRANKTNTQALESKKTDTHSNNEVIETDAAIW